MSEPLSVADILSRAADLIEPEGAWRGGGNFGGGRECYCVALAIDEVAGGIGCREGVQARLYFANLMSFKNQHSAIHSWNDASERTQAEVVAKLREAAAKAGASS